MRVRTSSAVAVIVGVLITMTAAIPANASITSGDPVAAEPEVSSETAGDVSIQSAFGSTPIGGFNYSFKGITISVPTGCFLSHNIEGSGLNVKSANGGVDCIGIAGTMTSLFCNWEIKWRYKDTTGTQYRLKSTGLYSNCMNQSGVKKEPNTPFTAKPGTACAEFWVNGVRRASQCHSITKS